MEPKNYWVLEENNPPMVYFQVPCGSLPRSMCFLVQVSTLHLSSPALAAPPRFRPSWTASGAVPRWHVW